MRNDCIVCVIVCMCVFVCTRGVLLYVLGRVVHRQKFQWRYFSTFLSRHYSDWRYYSFRRTESFLHHTTRMPTSPRDACFVVHDFVGGSIFTPLCHSAMFAVRLVVVPLYVLHSSSTVPTFDFLAVHQLCFNHAQAEVQPYCRFCTFQSHLLFQTLLRFPQLRQRWQLSRFFTWFWHYTNNNEEPKHL